jgi:hypothetical protein
MQKKKNVEYKITPQGSLGLLALGDVGVKLWRDSISKNLKKKKDKTTTQNDEKEK